MFQMNQSLIMLPVRLVPGDMVEQLGSGMRRILHTYNEQSFSFTDNFMRTSFYFDTNPAQAISTTAIEKNIDWLKENGCLTRHGNTKSGYWEVKQDS